MKNVITNMLEEKSYILADGATGTNLFSMGLQTGDAPEFWNADHPDRVSRHYESFIEAGSDLVLTNTFGGNRYRLQLHQGENRVAELNERAASLLRTAADACERKVLVAGDIGPTGEIFEPTGTLTIEAATEAFAEQAQALANGGADLIWIETLSSVEEARAAFAGARTTGLPVVFSMSIDTNGRTMMAAMVNMKSACEALPAPPALIAKANCGIPEWVDGEIVYNGTPELMARYAQLAFDSGARIIGGCCGTTPAHIRAMRDAMDNYQPGQTPQIKQIIGELGEVSLGARSQLEGDMSVAGGSASGATRRRGRRARRPA